MSSGELVKFNQQLIFTMNQQLIIVNIQHCQSHADLSEPVDGVKQQRANKVPLGFGQTLHLLHDVEVGKDQ